MKNQSLQVVICEKSREQFIFPIPVDAEDFGIVNFYCPLHGEIHLQPKQKRVGRTEIQINPKETAFYITVECDGLGCTEQCRIYSVALDNIQPKLFVETCFPKELEVKCNRKQVEPVRVINFPRVLKLEIPFLTPRQMPY